MGERLLCKQEVVGSIPSASTRHLKIGGWCRGPGVGNGCSGRDPSEGNATRKRELRLSSSGEDWSGIMDSVKTIVK